MSTYGYSRTMQKRNNSKKIAAMLLGVAVIAFGIVGGRTYFVNKKVNDTKEALTLIEEEKIKLQQQVETLGVEIENLEMQSKKLESVLWRFEPIIIPESMK